ncbi:MAG TPA: RodZ domain-containing protein [Allosphingosinicella sp.]|jgi:transcriptional regulator with XRE-family HTH domain
MADQAHNDSFSSRSIGARLQQAREEKGLSLEDVASQTRIPIRHLQHIEREEWDALPAITYCVGFVRSYGNIVGLNGAELGRELRERLGGTRTRAAAPEYYEPADPARAPPKSLAIIAAVLALALIVGYAIWRSSLDDPEEAPPAAEGTNIALAAPRPAAPVQQQPQGLAGQPVTLTATEEVWLRITEGSGGAALFQGTLASGQQFQLPATAQRPVIRTGRPQVLRVSVGARDLGPLEPVERTVADVSLRPEDIGARLQGGATPPAQ